MKLLWEEQTMEKIQCSCNSFSSMFKRFWVQILRVKLLNPRYSNPEPLNIEQKLLSLKLALIL